jgi:hypothetical protein
MSIVNINHPHQPRTVTAITKGATEVSFEIDIVNRILTGYKPKTESTLSYVTSYFYTPSSATPNNAIKFVDNILKEATALVQQIEKIEADSQEFAAQDTFASRVKLLSLTKKFHSLRLELLTKQQNIFTLLNQTPENKDKLQANIDYVEAKKQELQELIDQIDIVSTIEIPRQERELTLAATHAENIFKSSSEGLLVLMGLFETQNKIIEQCTPEAGTSVNPFVAPITKMNTILTDMHRLKSNPEKLASEKATFDALHQEFLKQQALFYETLAETNLTAQTAIKNKEEPQQSDVDSLRFLQSSNEVITDSYSLFLKMWQSQFAMESSDLVAEPTASTNVLGDKQAWTFSNWGTLLLKQESYLSYMNPSFQSNVNALIQKKTQLTNAQKLESNEQTATDLRQVEALLSHTFLVRIIDVIGEKQAAKKKAERENQPVKAALLNEEIEVLNKKYIEHLHTFRTNSDNDPKALEDITRKKQFADLGYSLINALASWRIRLAATTTPAEAMGMVVHDFIEWSKTNPKEAVNLAGDLTLVCSIFNDQSLKETLTTQMRTRAYGLAFAEAWEFFGPTSEVTEKGLEFYAISQLLKYAPVTTSVVKSVFEIDCSKPIASVAKIVSGAVTTFMVQGVCRQTCGTTANIGLQVLNFLRGDSIQELLEEQRNIELARIAGVTAAAVSSPSGFFRQVKRSVGLWFRTLKAARGLELTARIVTQIVLPVFATLAFVAATALVVTFSSGAAIFAVPSAGFTVLSAIMAFVVRIDGVFNRVFPARAQAEADLAAERAAKRTAAIEKELDANSEQISNQTEQYVQSLQKSSKLPAISSLDLEPLGDETSAEFQTAKDAIVNSIKIELNQKIADTASTMEPKEFVNVFVDNGIEGIATRVNEEVEKIDPLHPLAMSPTMKQRLAEAVIATLTEEWLKPRLNLAFKKQAMEFAVQDNGEEKVQFNAEAAIQNALRGVADDSIKTAANDELRRILSPQAA